MRPLKLIISVGASRKVHCLSIPAFRGEGKSCSDRGTTIWDYFGKTRQTRMGFTWVSLEFVLPPLPFVFPSPVSSSLARPFGQQWQHRSPCILVWFLVCHMRGRNAHRCAALSSLINCQISEVGFRKSLSRREDSVQVS